MKQVIFFVLVSTFSSCTYMTSGIFYSIEKEVLIPDAGDSLKNTVSVTGVARQGSTTYVAARSLFSKVDGTATWTRLTPGEWGTRMFALDVASGTGRVFVIASNNDATSMAVFQFDGTAWSELSGLAPGTPAALTEIYNSTGGLAGVYLSVLQANGTYVVQSINLGTGNVTTVTLNQTGGTSPVLGAAFDGTYYYLSFGDARLFRGTVANLTVLSQSFGGDIGGVSAQGAHFPVTGTDAIVSLSNGRIGWSVDNGSTWTFSASHSRNSGEPAVVLGPITLIASTLVAGSSVSGNYGGGYYEIVADGTGARLQNPTTLTAQLDNYNSTQLRDATITTFFRTTSELFAGTLGKGLFRQDAGLNWSWE